MTNIDIRNSQPTPSTTRKSKTAQPEQKKQPVSMGGDSLSLSPQTRKASAPSADPNEKTRSNGGIEVKAELWEGSLTNTDVKITPTGETNTMPPQGMGAIQGVGVGLTFKPSEDLGLGATFRNYAVPAGGIWPSQEIDFQGRYKALQAGYLIERFGEQPGEDSPIRNQTIGSVYVGLATDLNLSSHVFLGLDAKAGWGVQGMPDEAPHAFGKAEATLGYRHQGLSAEIGYRYGVTSGWVSKGDLNPRDLLQHQDTVANYGTTSGPFARLKLDF